MAENKDIYGGLDPEKLADQAVLEEAKEHHVEVTKPDGFADNEFAVRYTDDNNQEQDIVATRNPDRAGKDDEFDFWAPHKDPNTGKYTVKADIGNDILTLGINLYARNFYAKWYAEQKQAEAARQQGNPEKSLDGLEKQAEDLEKQNAELRNELGQQERQAPQVGAVPGQRSSVDERLDRIERNQQIMMDQLNRIEENQRSFFDKIMQKVGAGLELLGSGLEKLGNKLDKAGDDLLITSGRIQAGFDRLTGQENFAEYPSRPQPQQQGAGSPDLSKRIAELDAVALAGLAVGLGVDVLVVASTSTVGSREPIAINCSHNRRMFLRVDNFVYVCGAVASLLDVCSRFSTLPLRIRLRWSSAGRVLLER